MNKAIRESYFKLSILYWYLISKFARRFSSRHQLKRWQESKIVSFLTWVQEHSPYYAEKLSHLKSLRDWRQLPILDKTEMMKHFSRLNTVGIDRDQAFEIAFRAEETRDFTPTLNGVTVGLSSGTSGNRGLFLVADSERARHAGTILARVLPHSLLAKTRVAFFMRANSNLYTASKSRRLQFEFFDIFQNFEEHYGRLNSFQPNLLFGPPSALLQLAKAQLDGKLAVHPKRVYSIAETLDPLDERQLIRAFGGPIHQVYQCTEGFLAATCAHGTLHLNEDCVHIEKEWLDASRTKFQPIITDFSRTSQPIIRYRLNDILTLKKGPCPCGSSFLALESIEGRSDDVLEFGEKKVFPDFIRRAIIMSDARIEEYLVRQTKPDQLEISLRVQGEPHPDLEKEITSKVEAEIHKLSEQMGAPMPGLRFSREFPDLQKKKLRRVLRDLN